MMILIGNLQTRFLHSNISNFKDFGHENFKVTRND